jgi:LysM repeat protein
VARIVGMRILSPRTMKVYLAYLMVQCARAFLLLVIALWALGLATSSSYAQDDTSAPAAATDAGSASQDGAPAQAANHRNGEFSYSVRSGDSLGSIASTFGIQADDIARANRLQLDTTLMVGQTLRIPNPFAARMRELTGENQKLIDQLAQVQKRADGATAAQTDLRAQVQQLTANQRELAHQVRILPWWRDAVYSAVIVSLLLLGVAALAVLEWFLLRRRFIAVADLNESLRRLDQRYRALLAKAELRMQELYGRRRRGISDDQERPRLPEEAGLERLDQQLHDVLERHLKQLGGPVRPRRRSRWDEEFGVVPSPVEAPSSRR